MKNLNFKDFTFIAIFICLLIIFICISNIAYNYTIGEYLFENSINTIMNNNISDNFKIDKIVCFSSCDATSSINSNNTTSIANLSQFSDIAIFINNSVSDFNESNTLKNLYIKDITFHSLPNLGNPNLYFKGLTSFAKNEVDENNLIGNEFYFSISSDDEIDYNCPILFNNCANPITLSYNNSNIVNNYTISNNSYLAYDGSLLKNCNVVLADLKCSLSFTIYIENNLSQCFKCPVYIEIPLADENSSIYDGYYIYSYNPNFSFIKYN